tara:strand:- start:1897 stop:2334 length:438 start_codon:yes stop_codon:yes gene_type:complete
MLNDSFKLVGSLAIVVTGPDGQVKDKCEVHNLVVDSGKAFIAGRMTGTETVMSHMSLGTGTAAAVVADTTLGAEVGRVSLSSSSSAGAVATYAANFTAGTATGAITEAGIFNDAVAGVMLCRTVFAVVNKAAEDSMSITWQVTAS